MKIKFNLSRLAPSTRLLALIWPFIAIVALLVALAWESLQVLSAGRAYIEGESLWSKAQKQSLVHLMRYAHTHSEADYQAFRAALKVTLGDRKARLELEKAQPDYALAYQGFLEGRNHPDDIPGMIELFRRFRHVSYLDRSITLWADGDRSIDEFMKVANELHQRITAGETDPDKLYAVVERIFSVDAQLTPEEDSFSASLGEATRATKLALSIATIALAGTLLPLGVLLSRRVLKKSEAFEHALKLSEERFNLAVSGSNDGIWDWDMLTGRVYYSARFNELLGYSGHQIDSSPAALLSRLHPDDCDQAAEALSAHLKQDAAFDVEYRLKTRSGEYRWFRARGRSVRDASGNPVRMAGSLTDITDRKTAEAELFSAKERAQVTLQSIGDAVITTDMNGLVEYVNPSAEVLIGIPMQEAQGLPLYALFQIVDEKTRKQAPDPAETVLRQGKTLDRASEIVLVRRDGVEAAVAESAAPIRDWSGRATGVVLVFRDVSRERQYAARLSYQASHDALTGLINRREFENRVAKALESAAAMGREHAVLFLDLDQFKVVNDTCGHFAGDELMRQISAILQRRLREGDTLARLGGDEFGVLLENCGAVNALRLAEELRETVAEFPFTWEQRSFSASVSIGLVSVGASPFTLADALRAADAACYLAKEKGRNRVHLYQPDDTELSLRHGEMQWVGRIRQALEQDRFCLYAQEIRPVSASVHARKHLEILIRMIDEKGELIPPMQFIPAAERYNLMPLIDEWVIRTTFRTLQQLHQGSTAEEVKMCSINLSGASLVDDKFLSFVVDQFAQFGIRYDSICFEITETAAIANLAKAEGFIRRLRSLGCKFSLDDFGVGMSSFRYLKHLPVDFLKIDGTFVKDMVADPIDSAMVESIHNIGHVMGKLTIAEFVENDEILRRLRVIGVDYAQGYGIAKPQPFSVASAAAEEVAYRQRRHA